MAQSCGSEPASALAALATCRSVAIDEDTCALDIRLHSEHPAQQQPTPTSMHFVLDNSGSMGSNTRNAQSCFARLVSSATEPSSLTVFSNEATHIGNFTTASSMQAASLPRQGQTNITAGIQTALMEVRKQEAINGGTTHHVLILLSDGAHNVGPHPSTGLPQLGEALRNDLPRLRLSVVVVGVTSSSDTSMGMLLKRSLETVPLESLEPIYFASSAAKMSEVLVELTEGLSSLRGSLVKAQLTGPAGFVTSLGAEPVQEVTFMSGSGEQFFVVKTAAQSAKALELSIDGLPVPCLPMNVFDVEFASSALQPLLSRARVARVAGQAEGLARAAVEQLDQWVSAIERKCEQQSEGATFRLAGVSPQQRVAQHKSSTRLLHHARELRNHLTELEAFRVNNSAEQAAFLTGKSSKYAGKALKRAAQRGGGVQGSVSGLVEDMCAQGAKLPAALRRDLRAKISALPETMRQRLQECLEASGSSGSSEAASLCRGEVSPSTDALLDGQVMEHLQTLLGARQSYLSLNTPGQQLSEWRTVADAGHLCGSGYELLMFVGSLGYPIEVRRRDATQMNPFAMEVANVHSTLADTASLLCALQSEQELTPPEGGKPIEDLLVLVDPDFPQASRIVVNSVLLRETYTSVVLCRDLHMYTGNLMRIALHAHALLAAAQPVQREWDGLPVQEAALVAPPPFTEARIQLLLRICYSARKIWQLDEMADLCSKMENWEDLTTADGVEHPVKLLLALAAADVGKGCLDPVPVLMLLNEVCARKAHDDVKAGVKAESRVRAFLGITAESAPTCAALGEAEPLYEVVAADCCADYDLDTGAAAFDFQSWVLDAVLRYVPALHFVRQLHACLAHRQGGWAKLEQDMEAGPWAYEDVVAHLKADQSSQSLLECLGTTHLQLQRTLATMAAQAYLYGNSHSRRLKEVGGDLEQPLGNVTDGDTLRALAVKGRMGIYLGRVQEKMREWQREGTEMTRARAVVADLGQYSDLCSSHVHGLSKPEFWGLWRAALADGGPNGQKALAFLSRANHDFCNKHRLPR